MKFTSRAGAQFEAVQWNGKNLPEVIRSLRGISTKGEVDALGALSMGVPGGSVVIPVDHWIVRESGKIFTISPADFSSSYT